MKDVLENSAFKWCIQKPIDKNKKLALVIPFFNESNDTTIFENRLSYFNDLGRKYCSYLDIILVNDGSSDSSLQLAQNFLNDNDQYFYLASVFPNRDKVGALYLAVVNIIHPFVILSDFDTQISRIDVLINSIDSLFSKSSTMGAYFRMLPSNGNGNVFLYQVLEYSIARIYYKFHQREGIIPVMPGAGSLYDRNILIDIYKMHSGLRNGEDRETTLLGYKKGYSAVYLNQVLTLTSPPSTYSSLIKQRIRWNLGYIETYYKERSYYYKLLLKKSTISIRCFLDLFWVTLILMITILSIALLFLSIKYFIVLTLFLYISCFIWSFLVIVIDSKETNELHNNIIKTIILFPIYKISIDCLSWWGAVYSFFNNLIKNKYHS